MIGITLVYFEILGPLSGAQLALSVEYPIYMM